MSIKRALRLAGLAVSIVALALTILVEFSRLGGGSKSIMVFMSYNLVTSAEAAAAFAYAVLRSKAPSVNSLWLLPHIAVFACGLAAGLGLALSLAYLAWYVAMLYAIKLLVHLI